MGSRVPRPPRNGGKKLRRRGGKSGPPRGDLLSAAISFEWLEARCLLSGQPWETPRTALDDTGREFIDGHISVALHTPTLLNSQAQVDAFLGGQTWPAPLAGLATTFKLDYSFLHTSGEFHAVGEFVITVGLGTVDTARALSGLSFVAWAEPDYVSTVSVQSFPSGPPNDPLFDQQWFHQNISTPPAWLTTTGMDNVLIAIIDDGVHMAHPDLAANIWTNPRDTTVNGVDEDGNGFYDDVHGWDFVSNDNDPSPVPIIDPIDAAKTVVRTHGTEVAGTAAGVINNAVGVSGVAGGAKILPLRVAGDKFYLDDAIHRSERYAADIAQLNGMNLIINESFGSSQRYSLEDLESLDYAYGKGGAHRQIGRKWRQGRRGRSQCSPASSRLRRDRGSEHAARSKNGL